MGTKRNNIVAGARVAYSANFLRCQGIYSGSAPQRRGTVVSVDGAYSRVRWDNFDAKSSAAQWGEDYAEDAIANGQMVSTHVLASLGSSAMVAL
jgi:hypothetical protein